MTTAPSSLLDPAAVDRLRGALAEWTIVAQTAELAAHRAQRQATHELLQEARRVALGIESIDQLLVQHSAAGRAIAAGRAGTATTITRLERRRADLSRLIDAAARVNAGATSVQAAFDVVVSELAAVETSLRGASELAVELEAAAVRHAVDGQVLSDLRTEFATQLVEARSALAAMQAAGSQLQASRELYEAAQLRSIDLRHTGFPPPSGPPLPAPTTDPVGHLVSA